MRNYLAVAIFFLAGSGFIYSEPVSFYTNNFPAHDSINFGTDPSLPLTRIDLQNNFYWDWYELKDDRFYNSFQLFGGKVLLNNKFYISVRIPIVATNLNFTTLTGIGDLTFDFRVTTAKKKDKINFFTGTEFIFPTAAYNETGLGKYIAGPYAGFINYFSSGYYGLILTDYFSYAGQNNRSDISELSINPLFNIYIGKNWYTLITPDIVYTFKTGKLFVPYTQEFGTILSKNIITSLKAGVHLKNDNKYDVLAEIKFSYLFNN